MRIHQLDVSHYGPFATKSLFLGEGLTVIYGPNEAGKSTLLDALGDFLWGIRSKSHPRAYAYRPAMMRVEGYVRHDGTEHRWTRRLGALSDESRLDIVPVWDPDRTGDAESWRTCYGLSRDVLRDGGHKILAGHGDLADLVFLAETGVPLDAVRREIADQLEKIYKQRAGSKCTVRAEITEISRLEEIIEKSEAHAKDVTDLRAEIERTHQRLALLTDRWEKSRRELVRLDEHERCLPFAAELRDFETELAALRATGDTLEEPSTGILARALHQLEVCDDGLADVKESAGAAQERRKQLVLTPAILAVEDTITALREQLGARRGDQARLKDEDGVTVRREAVSSILCSLGRIPGPDVATDVEVLLLSEPIREQLAHLAAQASQEEKSRAKQQARVDAIAAALSADVGLEDGGSDQLTDARLARDAAWESVRTPWLSGYLPDAGERHTRAAKVDDQIEAADQVAENHAEKLADAAEGRGSRKEREQQLDAAQNELHAITQSTQKNQAAWSDLTISVGLPAGMDADAWAAHERLLARLTRAWQDLESYQHSVDAARVRLASFSSSVGDLAGLVAATHSDPVRQVEALAAALTHATKTHSADVEIQQTLADLEGRRANTQGKRVAAQHVIAALTNGIDVPVEALLARSQKRVELERSIATLADQLKAAKDVGTDVQDLLSALAGADLVAIETARTSATADATGLKAAIEELSEELGAAKQRLSSLETRASMAETRALAFSHGEQLRALVGHYQELALQVALLDEFRERMLQSSNSPVLDQAGRHLARLTGGRYAGFEVLADEDGRHLEVVTGTEGAVTTEAVTVPLSGLSEGTADQVFLALRLAGIQSRQAERVASGLPTLPVALDDVLIAHDDERTRAAIEVIVDVARDAQVLVFTHHRSVLNSASSIEGATTAMLDPATS